MNASRIALIVLIFIGHIGYSQKSSSQSNEEALKLIVGRNLSFHFFSTCSPFEDNYSSIIITLSSRATVEKVLFSKGSECYKKILHDIEQNIMAGVSGLSLNKKEFGNTAVVFFIKISPERRRDEPSSESVSWDNIASNLSFQEMKGKSIKYIIPIEMILLGPVHQKP